MLSLHGDLDGPERTEFADDGFESVAGDPLAAGTGPR